MAKRGLALNEWEHEGTVTMIYRGMHAWLSGLLLLGVVCPLVRGEANDAPVVVSDDATTATISNGIVAAKINKANGNMLSLEYKQLSLLSKGGAYWNIYGEIPGQPNTQEKGTPSEYVVSQDPAKTNGDLGEITLRFPYHNQEKAVPMDIEIRYSLKRGASGVYGWTIADHKPDYPPFTIEVSTVCFKLNPEIFDFLSVDSRRQKEMPSAEDWVKGTQLNLWEARRLNTGIHKGEVEHKYDYNTLFSETPAYGWSSTKQHVGMYIVNPSIEYIPGSPVSVDYGGHIDVKASLPADPTMLFIWHTSHYGGRGIEVKAKESWQKIIGPFLIYCDAGQTPDAMWKDAMTQAAHEQQQWPYAWAQAPGYLHKEERGNVSGQLTVRDPQASAASAANAWVGLAQEPYVADFKKGPITIDWETDGKHYQYWTHADTSGAFTIPNARPGHYTLYAFNSGILGDFRHADVEVKAGETVNLGSLTWTPVRYGKQLWDIGIPDRSAGEFLHGDHYWQWGLYNLYPDEFPNDVNYEIGKSDYHKDWNYCQPPRPDGKGWKNTTWHIRFNVRSPMQGTATLRLAICGARGGPVDVALNGSPIGTTGELPESGVMHRDGIRAASLTERDIRFNAADLKPGENVIDLTKEAKAWTDGVLYDYVRLELDTGKSFAP